MRTDQSQLKGQSRVTDDAYPKRYVVRTRQTPELALKSRAQNLPTRFSSGLFRVVHRIYTHVFIHPIAGRVV
ncbi:hypothetical protein PsYK624_016410 [Phanerochaete sordida]|uniref:Uncharacterized protein n=1 Tax=Phanerochaete sordida TaxID=48140 RepID=A0A9P3FZW5_9APHY|nr:hypothetical protein PsYK624_016410 [Phanerochaete sordida]